MKTKIYVITTRLLKLSQSHIVIFTSCSLRGCFNTKRKMLKKIPLMHYLRSKD